MSALKEFIKQKFPFVQRWYEKWRYRENLKLSHEEIFTKYYQSNYWKDKESFSGQGSNQVQTESIRKELPKLLKEFQVRSVLDVPCGDFNWMQSIVYEIPEYTGVDIVKELIERNNKNYGKPGVRFLHADVTKDILPASDLVLVRDLFIHFSDEDIFKAIANLKRSGSRFLLTTTFPERKANYNIYTGSWRPVNLQKAPFNFPEPIFSINENNTEDADRYADKALGLWKLSAIDF